MYSKKVQKSALESLMFIWGEPLAIKDAAEVLESGKKEIEESFEELMTEYEQEGRGIRLRRVGDAYQYVTLAENELFISKLCTPVKVKRLSQAALEVLAIIAYRQPVTRGEIDAIRGIKSERVLDGLMNRGMVEVAGRSEGVGRPLLYRTTEEFLKKFGFASLEELPDIAEFDDLHAPDAEGSALHEQISLNFGAEDAAEKEEREDADQ